MFCLQIEQRVLQQEVLAVSPLQGIGVLVTLPSQFGHLIPRVLQLLLQLLELLGLRLLSLEVSQMGLRCPRNLLVLSLEQL